MPGVPRFGHRRLKRSWPLTEREEREHHDEPDRGHCLKYPAMFAHWASTAVCTSESATVDGTVSGVIGLFDCDAINAATIAFHLVGF